MIETGGPNTSTSSTIQLTHGAYSEFFSSTSADCYWATVRVSFSSTDNTCNLAIATGAAASEVDLIEFQFWGNGGVTQNHFHFPLFISSGSRVSLKTTNGEPFVSLSLSNEPDFGTFQEAEFIGQSGVNGTTIDAGGTANTKSGWVELAASTSHDYDYIMVHAGSDGDAATQNSGFLIDIATGAAASEVVILENFYAYQNTSEANQNNGQFWVSIPSGSRVSARAQSSNATVDYREIDVSITGIRVTAPSGGGGGEDFHISFS